MTQMDDTNRLKFENLFAQLSDMKVVNISQKSELDALRNKIRKMELDKAEFADQNRLVLEL